jgi:hypothetical protein
MLTKPSAELTLFDTLSRLTFTSVTKLLGAEGDRLIAAGGKYDIDIASRRTARRKWQASSRPVSTSAWSVTSRAGRGLPSRCRTKPRSRIWPVSGLAAHGARSS